MAEDRRVRDVGEFGLIAMLTAELPDAARAMAGLSLGIGDDAAVWQPTEGTSVVITTDSLIEDIHFRTAWTDWESLGHKTLAVNVSDLAAMGATPRVATVTLGLRGDELIADLRAFYRGLGELAVQHGMTIAGGDIVRSPRALLFHATALGEAPQGRVLTRAGAQPGDVIAVSGTLGASAAGMRLLELDESDPRRHATTADLLIQTHLRPEPHVALGRTLLEHGATSAMDLSDGLMGDLPKILEASGRSAVIDTRAIPVAAAVRALFPGDWLELALRGGEDYELLFTVPRARWREVVEAANQSGDVVTAIGAISASQGARHTVTVIATDGSRSSALPGAFDHFERDGGDVANSAARW